MAEVLGVASGIFGILSLTIQVTQLAVQFGLDWKDAPHDVRSLLTELSSLKTILSETQTNLVLNADLAEALQDRPSLLLSELGPNSSAETETKIALRLCKEELESLLKDCKKNARGHRLGWERLKTPFLSKTLRRSVEKVYRQCRQLNDMVSIDAMAVGINTLGEVKQGRKEQKQWHDEQQNQKILEWLSTLSFARKQNDILSKRHPGTGEWFLNLDKFKAWRDGCGDTTRNLWCPGMPGAGKSVLTSIVIEHLQQMYVEDDVAILYVFCDYKDRTAQTTAQVLGSLVQQMILQCKDMPQDVIDLHAKGKGPLSTQDCTSLLSSLLHDFERTIVLVDAVDELFANDSEGGPLELTFLDKLLELQQTFRGCALFVTSRENPVVQRRLANAVRLEVYAADADIELYLRSRIYDDTKFRFASKMRDDSGLAELVVNSLLEKARGMFLLPRLHLDRLACQTSVRGLREALVTLPTQLNETYDEAMARIQGQVPEHRDLALSALKWILYAYRPLRQQELQGALAIRLGDTDFDTEAVQDIDLIVSVYGGLITVDAESGIVRLVHFTVQQYFMQTTAKFFQNAKRPHLPDANAIIAQTCLTCLSFTFLKLEDRAPLGIFLNDPQYVFDYYAAAYWGYHLCAETEIALESQLLDFLNDEECLRQPKGTFLASMNAHQDQHFRPTRTSFDLSFYHEVSAAHLLIFFGLTHTLTNYLKEHSLRNVQTSLWTPLQLAIIMGRENIVSLLVAREDVELEPLDYRGRTPLIWAAKQGLEAIVVILLNREGVHADYKDGQGRTSLHYAAMHGHGSIVALLLKRSDVAVNSQDVHLRTPLSYAAEKGFKHITQRLLRRPDVSAGGKDMWGRTALFRAAGNGQLAVVELLMERGDVAISQRDLEGGTALSIAVSHGYEELSEFMKRRMLEKGLDVEALAKTVDDLTIYG